MGEFPINFWDTSRSTLHFTPGRTATCRHDTLPWLVPIPVEPTVSPASGRFHATANEPLACTRGYSPTAKACALAVVCGTTSESRPGEHKTPGL